MTANKPDRQTSAPTTPGRSNRRKPSVPRAPRRPVRARGLRSAFIRGKGIWVPVCGVLEPELSIGDLRVYPPHGVGEITAIGSFEEATNGEMFYTMLIVDTGMRLLFPARRLDEIGLRELITADEVKGVFDVLRRPRKRGRKPSWNKHQRLLAAKLLTGSIYDAAEVINTIYVLKERKSLSLTERRLLDSALGLVLPELSIVCGRTEKELDEDIRSHFGL